MTNNVRAGIENAEPVVTPKDAGNSINTGASKEEKCRIRIEQFEEFTPGVRTTLMTSVDLCQKISAIFGEIFSDYVGCKIRINDGSRPAINKYVGGGIPYVELYFKDLPKSGNGIKNIFLQNSNEDDAEKEQKKDLGHRLVGMNSPTPTSHAYKVGRKTLEALEEFITPPNRNTRLVWNELISEVQEGMNVYALNKREILVCVSGLSIAALIEKMFGKEVNGTRYEYSINIVSRIMTPGNIAGDTNGFIFTINQLDWTLIRRLEKSLGIGGVDNYVSYR